MKAKSVMIMLLAGLLGCAGIYKKEGVEQLPPEQYLARLTSTGDAYLIDVRTPGEYRRDHLEGAENVNFFSFSLGRRLDSLDPGRPVFLYCHSQHRSPMVVKKLYKRGFRQIVDLEGGFRKLER